MKKKLAIIGAFDRYNYGDLLFPILIEKEFLNVKDEYSIEFYALLESDLSRYGAKPTKAMRELFRDEVVDGSIFMIAGGDVVGAEWVIMHKYLHSGLESILLRGIRKYTPMDKQVDRYLMRKYKSKTELPWVISKNMFKNKVKIIYNSVGGSNLKRHTNYYKNYIKEHLSDTDYISVREEDTKNELLKIGVDKDIFVAPDSAVIMSEYYPKDLLFSMVRDDIKEIKGDYICFQTNKYSGMENLQLIISELRKVYDKYGFKIVLLPIGTALGHEDQVPLGEIKKRLKEICYLPEELTVFEVMYLIAASKGYIGTSLHGAITSLSYGIPHLGLIKDVDKLKSFLMCWSVGELRKGIGFDEIFSGIDKMISVSKEELLKKREEMIGLVKGNYDRIKRLVN